jgi:hypothetical protein
MIIAPIADIVGTATATFVRVLHAADLHLTGPFQASMTLSNDFNDKQEVCSMAFVRKHFTLMAVAASCVAIGAGASAIASAGAASTGSPAGHGPAVHVRRGLRGAFARAVHGQGVVATKTGFATVTLDRGFVQSVNGQQLTIREGTKTRTYNTVTLTIPTNARVRDNRANATLADVKAGQHVLVLQGPKRTLVIARNARS